MIQRPTRKVHRNIEEVQINITPVMNLFVVLIPFLLISAAFIQLSVIDTTLPKLATSDSVQQEEKKEKLVVTLNITKRGFEVGRLGGDSKSQGTWGKGGKFAKIIPKKNAEDYDGKGLNLLMYEIKKAYPDSDNVLIFPEEDISYDVIVSAMDATREIFLSKKESGKSGDVMFLFPNAVLGHASEGK